ncbi:hypothetical protein [Candidatus Methylobacter oryzae]|uniref:Uncharacterized protein n=1 Tax=Candidatus Methylobacter oryzae TaxID=2497749 RepID=A0ABY3C825_9GAMM|nr:hypothetical protein [Candidatus Methylobacter oryzae]TRW92696.1 hypothetical protein EKO24_014815 [Candidatus Methylobacter oryzae]
MILPYPGTGSASSEGSWRIIRDKINTSSKTSALALTLPVEEIYHRVQNEDMVEFLISKAEQ